jgi:flavin-dependent dehydrogenase
MAMKVAATVEMHEAARRAWDAVVIGAGPAGAMAARELARRKLAVLLVDKATFPRWKVCGSCFNLRALAALESAGLGRLMSRLAAAPLERFCLAGWGRRATARLPGGVSVSREAFDAALVEAAIEAGVAFLPRTQALLADSTRDARRVLLRFGSAEAEVEGRVVLAANGLGGKFNAGERVLDVPAGQGSRIGAGVVAIQAPSFYAPGTIYMACSRGGYVGLVRLEDGRLDVAAAFDSKFIRTQGGLAAAAVAVLDQAGFPAIAELAEAPWRGTPPLTRRAERLAARRVFLLGDAAGYIEPFTGEGIAWALASGAAVAPLAAQAVRAWDRAIERHWEAVHRRLVVRRQRVCRVVAAGLRRPLLARGLITVLAWTPVLASPLIHYLNKSLSTDALPKGVSA